MKSKRRPYKPPMNGKCWYCANPLGKQHLVLTSPDGHKVIVHRICSVPAIQLMNYPLKETTC